MSVFLFCDTETGGIDPATSSLLTAHFEVVNGSNDTLGELSLALKPDEGPILAFPQALAVNRIDLTAHEALSIRYSEGRDQLMAFCRSVGKPVPVAWNLAFDKSFLAYHLGNLDAVLDYRGIDLLSYYRFRQFATGQRDFGRLSAVAESYGISTAGAHGAAADVRILRELFFAMRDEARVPR